MDRRICRYMSCFYCDLTMTDWVIIWDHLFIDILLFSLKTVWEVDSHILQAGICSEYWGTVRLELDTWVPKRCEMFFLINLKFSNINKNLQSLGIFLSSKHTCILILLGSLELNLCDIFGIYEDLELQITILYLLQAYIVWAWFQMFACFY